MRRLLGWVRRRWLLLLLLAGFAVLIAVSYGDLEEAFRTLIRGQWQWILLATLLQAAYRVVYAYEYTLGFAAVGVRGGLLELLPVLFASTFVKTVVPSGGVSSVAVFAEDAARRGQSPARAAEGSLLILLLDLLTVTPLVSVALVYLASRQVLRPYQTLTTILFYLFAASLSGVVLLGRWLPERLRSLLVWLQENANRMAIRLRRAAVLPAGWANEQAEQFIGAARGLSGHPRLLAYTSAVALAGHLVNLASLLGLSLAFGPWLGLGALTAAFSMNIVFSVITIIPHGIGVAESVIVLVFGSLGVATPTAVAIALAYRGLSLWLPLFIGFLSLRRTGALGGGGRH